MKRRLFVAVDLPDVVKARFNNFFEKTKDIIEVKWEKEQKIHLTLAFLGFVEEERVPSLLLLLKKIGKKQKPFHLLVSPKVEGFPTLSNPRVVWLPIIGDVDSLKQVTDKLRGRLRENNFDFDDRDFVPHLTLGRFRSGVKKWQKEKIVQQIKDLLFPNSLPFKVKGITLYKSQPVREGSFYTKLFYEDFGY